MDSKEINSQINKLLKRIKENDLFALGELLDLKSPAIAKIAYSVLHDRLLAEDVVNEVIIALIKNIHNFKNQNNLNGWINAVTINRSIDFLRKKNFEMPFIEDYFTNIPSPFDENKLVEKLTVISALEALENLERNILIDKFINNRTFNELSKKYGISIKKTRNILNKAKTSFAKFYLEKK